MKIINQTRNTLLAQEVLVADTFWARITGLLGQRDLPVGKAVLIKPCNSIHTFFMRFAIDVIFVDIDNKVIKAISCLKPYHLSRVYWSSHFVIEFRAGTIVSTFTQEGDSISIAI